MSKKLENAIIIGGTVYELIEDRGDDECQRCALLLTCEGFNKTLCVSLFADVISKRFEERTDL